MDYRNTEHKQTLRTNLDKWLPYIKNYCTPCINLDTDFEIVPTMFMSSIYNSVLYISRKTKNQYYGCYQPIFVVYWGGGGREGSSIFGDRGLLFHCC